MLYLASVREDRKSDCCVLYVNGVAVLRRKFWDDLDPDNYNYFPVVDLLGSCLEVTYLPVFVPNVAPEVPL